MKLFREIETRRYEYEIPEMKLKKGKDIPTHTGNYRTITQIKIKMEMIDETVNYLLDKKHKGSTLSSIRDLILNLYNYKNYKINLFALLRNADEEHAELVVDIINACGLKYGDSCFLMLDELVPEILKMRR